MPSIQSFFQKQPANRASTPSLVHTPPGPTSSSSRPNNSVPAQGPAQYGRPTISTQAGPAATISLVPPGPPSTLPSPLTPSPGSRGGEFAAEHQNQRGLHPSNGGGSNTDLSDNPTFNPSSSSSAASASSARRGGEINPQPQPSNRKPVGIGFFSRPTSSVVAPPASPQPGSSGGGSGGSLSRRISTRHTKQQPSSEPQSYHQQPPHDTEGLDPYLQQQPPGRSTRPQSVLPSPRESEAIDYAVNRGGEFQRHNSFSQPSLASQQQQQQQQQQQPQQPQYYEQGQEYQQQQQKQQQEYQTQHLQQPQQQQQEGHMSPGPRPSVDVMRQPPSRDASTLSQLHQQQQYAQQQRTNSNESYQNQGGQPGGQQNQTYDPSKYDEQGRATPEVRSQSRAGDVQTQESLGLQQALQELETLQNKYRKVKALYFDRSAEIERLQNTLAHQRLAQSRTSLDDNEYTSRFERLDGAIKNVAFEIRQSWKSIPNWLTNVINAGAAAKGGREMTVVGRATISRWVVDEILEQFFHPALDTMLSIQLKEIERNIRLLAPAPQTVEDDDALSTKVCNWRLTTLDALQGLINSPQALDTRTRLAEELVHRLVEYLRLHLQEPYPPGLLGGVQMVVDIAIGLASNLPVESRDVRVWYPLPGCRFDAKFMKGEGGLPPLGTPASSLPEPEKMQTDNNSNNSGDNAADEGPQAPPKDGVGNPSTRAGVAGLPGQQKQDTKKSSGFSGRVKKALHGAGAGTQAAAPQPPPSPGAPPQGQGVNVSKQQQQGSQVSLPVGQEGKGDVEKIRVAGFMAVEVRGRSILVKAPVWL